MSDNRLKLYVTVYPLVVRVDHEPRQNVHVRNAAYRQSNWHHSDCTILIKYDALAGSRPRWGVINNAIVNAVQSRGMSVQALRYSKNSGGRPRKKKVSDRQLKLL